MTDNLRQKIKLNFMFRSKQTKKRKEPERYYLLPGQGGRAYRRKQVYLLKWSVVAGLVVSAIMAAILYWIDRAKPH
ncbi:MAG TPA: hypothetical protein VK769_02565 [Verrucomicrobiae bacterium]|nr:hypothetical protein [Verrucomicrobiae bacterium]